MCLASVSLVNDAKLLPFSSSFSFFFSFSSTISSSKTEEEALIPSFQSCLSSLFTGFLGHSFS
ncbi:hypothetical protein DsansV1_C24g0180551 [Dioscorea sansibarensis]